jgi:FlaA1/EpsC-like NDP-sugar epimerase
MDASAVRVPGRAPRWIVPTVKVFLVSADAIAAALSFIIAFMYREGVSAFDGHWRWSNQFAPYGTLLILVVAIRLLSLRYANLYRIRGEFSFVDDGLRVFKATAIGSLLIVAAAFLYRGGFTFRSFSYAPRFYCGFFLCADQHWCHSFCNASRANNRA